MTVAVGNVAPGSSMSPEQLGSVQSSSEQDGPPNKRLRRVACSCPNCRDGEGRYEKPAAQNDRACRCKPARAADLHVAQSQMAARSKKKKSIVG